MALMLPFLLVAGWMLNSEQLIFLRSSWRLLLVGLALLLAGIPFHFWLRPLLEEAAPLAVVFLLGLSQLVLVAFAGIAIGENPVLGQTEFGAWLRLLGVATMVAAALLLLAARQVEQAIAYGILLDAGMVLATLGTGSAGLPTALSLVLARTVALTLVMLAWQFLRQADEDADGPASDRARSSWLPFLLGYGALSLVGLPLTPGFAGRWQAVALLGEQTLGLALLAVLAMATSAAGMWRALPHPRLPRLDELLARQHWSVPHIVAAFLLLAALLLALFPDWLPVLVAVAGPAG
jgi:formate hydrogenlyase subunit 3/multisubunit Na+/H+ antiporter MnhD subunit